MPSFKARKHLRLRFRIAVSLVSLVAGSVAVVILVVDAHERQILVEVSREKGLAIGHSLAAAASHELLSYNYISLQQLAQKAADEEGLGYVIILDKEGVVAGMNGDPVHQGKKLADRVSRAAERSSGTLVQTVRTASLGRSPGLDIAVPVYVEGSPQKWGTVRIGLSLDSMYARSNEVRLWALGLGLAVIALSLFVALLLSRHITGPLNRLVEATAELARGNFDFRMNLTTGDEIEVLAAKFEDMAGEIRLKQTEAAQANRELAALNASLEAEVRRRTQAHLEAEEKYRILVDHSPNPICIMQGRRLVFFNRAFVETFGYRTEELQAPDFDLFTLFGGSDGRSIGGLGEAMAKASPGHIAFTELRGLHKNGAPIDVDMRSTGISYEGVPAVEAILVDVTERRKIQDQMVAYERLRALGEMAGGVAHDFNNVLGAILARAQMLQRYSPEEKTLRGLQIIEKAARDGAETVKRIQNFTRVRTEQDFVPLRLHPVLEDVLEMTRGRWEDEAHRQGKSIQVIRELQDVPPIRGNVSELREVFTNFILNAVDAISGQGSITVRTWGEGHKVVVLFSDTGEGMTPEVQRRLFDPFFTTKGAGGTGLGMSVAYGITRRHGATIDVQSERGKGTTFRLEFPALKATEAAVPEVAVSPVSVAGSEKILVVDDQAEIRDLLHDVLHAEGYRVVRCSEGEDALARLEQESFDLVITDLGMPGLSGWEVARGARARRPEIRIILLTGWAATLDAEEIQRSGVNRTLKKPFEMDGLLRAVRDVIGPARLAA